MEKMRKEFNDAVATGAIIPDFFCVTSGYSSSIKWLSDDWDGKKYKSDKIQSAWSIWKASRSALCVKLPETIDDECGSFAEMSCLTRSLDDAGVRYE